MSLEILSNEILTEIIQYLGLQANTRLRHLALCSKRFNTLATPHLYDTFIQGTWNQDQAFARTLLSKPELGGYVKGVQTGSCGYYDESAKDFEFNDEELSKCKARVEGLECSSEEVEKWIGDLEDKEWDALIGLLLSCMPNVASIDMQAYRSWDTNAIDRVLKNAECLQAQGSDSPLALNKLESVSVAWYDTENGLGIDTILPFIEPKSVTYAEFFAVSDESSVGPGAPPKLAAKTLLLNYSLIDGDALVSFLRCFHNLEKFLYNPGGATVGFSEFLPQDVGRAIAHLKHSLEDLTINTGDAEDDTFGDEDRTRIGSLAEFEKLHSISLTADVLFGPLDGEEDMDDNLRPRLVDILPKALKRMELFRYDPPVIEQMLELLECREEVVPELALIRLESRLGHSGQEKQPADLGEAIKKLRDKCKAAGIHLFIAPA